MSGNKPIEENTVQSIGSSWIICKSKSRSGHVYYFNTLTGETVWNLSDAEIEKANKDTKKQTDTHHLVKSPDSNEQFSVQCKESANTSINQITQIKKQEIPNLALSRFANGCVSYSSSRNDFTSINTSAFNLGQNNSFNHSMNLNNMPSMYNPNIWAVPQQIFIAPAMSPLVNQAPAALNIGYKNIHQTITGDNISEPLFHHYEVTNQVGNSPTRKTVHNFRKNFRNFGQNRPNTFNYNSRNRNDLRSKISANKRFQFNKSSPCTFRAHNFGNRQQKKNPNFNIRHSFAPDGGSKQYVYEDTPSRLDLTPLKIFATANVQDICLIVVDMNVILNEFMFLNNLSDSDAQCRLVVPQHVMSELEHYTAASQDVQARRIQRFLSQKIDHGDVMIAEESDDDHDTTTPNLLLSTCLKLSKENYHVVLLTNDSELINYKNVLPITILTPNYAKTLLKVDSIKNNFPISKPSTFIPNRPITKLSINSESDNKVPKNITVNKIHNSHVSPKVEMECNAKAIISPEPIKKTMDAAIQTDFIIFNATSAIESKKNTKDLENQTRDGVKNMENKSKENQTRDEAKNMETKSKKNETPDEVINMENKSNTDAVTWVSADKLIKMRTIKLKRTIPNQPSLAPLKINEKRNFKWRRRRNPLSQVKETVPENLDLKNKSNNTKIEHYPKDVLSNSEVIEETLNKSKSEDVVKSNTSIASSDASILSKKFIDHNIIVEETSTSGISNTASNVDIEIDSIKHLKSQLNLGFENMEIKTVLYGVDSPSMEEYLVMKCDEWVSRFIQIMEEALTVVLQHDPPFSHDSLPPPWTIYEAAQCVKMKFSTNEFIKDATFKLSNILLKVSDRRGKINLNIKPSEYMEMYSFGVYLLDTITTVVDNCEDLQIGVESLKKLLNDIQNPNLDQSAQETFTDVSLDHVSVQISSGTTSQSCIVTPKKVLSPEKFLFNKYNLRSGKKRKLFQNDEVVSKTGRTLNPESTFFTSLKLQRNIDFSNLKTIKQTISNDKQISNDLCNDGHTEENNLERGVKETARISDTSSSSDSEHGSNMSNEKRDVENEDCLTEPPMPLKDLLKSNHSDNQDEVQDNVFNKPTVVFRFKKCLEMEDKLKNVFEQDYEEDYEYPSEEYDSEDQYDEISGHDEGDIEMDDDKEIEDGEIISVKSPEVPEIVSNNNKINEFKYVFGAVLQDIQEAFYAVKNICESYFEDSKKPQGPKMKRIELRVKVKNAAAHIHDVCKSLDSMLERESKNSKNNMAALFRKAGYQDFYFDDELKSEYSDTITKCKNYAEIVLKCIQHILLTLNC